MAEATLDTTAPINPTQWKKARLVSATLYFRARYLALHYELIDESGVVVREHNERADGAAVQTYITNQENTILTRLLAKLGFTTGYTIA